MITKPITTARITVIAGTSAASIRSSANPVSDSKVSAVFSSMVSSAPDSSPTWIICSASRGNRLPLPSATDRPTPFFTSAAAASTSRIKAWFPMIRPPMPIAVNNGTPFLSRVPTVRASRAVSILATIGPTMRCRSSHSSKRARNSGVRHLRANSQAPTAGIAMNSHHQSRTNRPSASTKRENSGSSVSRFSYIAANCGTT